MKFNIRLLYLYLFSFVGLLITIIGSTNLVSLGLKVYVFDNADIQDNQNYREVKPMPVDENFIALPEVSEEERTADLLKEATKRRQREVSNSLSMIIVGIPLYLYHWGTIKKEKK
jgi:hypothetical protein